MLLLSARSAVLLASYDEHDAEDFSFVSKIFKRKNMMKKTSILLIFLSINSLYPSAMTVIASKKYARDSKPLGKIVVRPSTIEKKSSVSHRTCGECQSSLVEQSGVFHKLLPPEIDQYIIDNVATHDNVIDLKKVAQGINSLARTNKFLNWYMNDDKVALNCIKKLSQQCGISNQDVAKMLRTFTALKYLTFYEAASDVIGLEFNYSREQIDRLYLLGLDVNFTADSDSRTLLTDAIECNRCDQVDLLIKKGIDINLCNTHGQNGAMQSYRVHLKNSFLLLLDCLSLNVNHQDNQGDTLLHYCIKKVYALDYSIDERLQYVYEPMYSVIEKLLTKKANPTIKNNEGKTPLDLALCMEDPRNKGSFLKVEYPQVIEQLMQAEFNWLENHTD